MNNEWLYLYLQFFFDAFKGNQTLQWVLEEMEKSLGSHDLDVFLIEARENKYPLMPDERALFIMAHDFLSEINNDFARLVSNRNITIEKFCELVAKNSATLLYSPKVN